MKDLMEKIHPNAANGKRWKVKKRPELFKADALRARIAVVAFGFFGCD